MLMKPALRKFALTAHITSSVGWLGAALGFLAHAITGLTSQDAGTVRAAYLMMELTGWYVLVPLSFASLVTGLLESLGTSWGLIRHYWVLAKLLLTVFATIVLLIFMRGFGNIMRAAVDPLLTAGNAVEHGAASPIVHAGLGVLVLLAAVLLSVFKPWGQIKYGKFTRA